MKTFHIDELILDSTWTGISTGIDNSSVCASITFNVKLTLDFRIRFRRTW